MNYLRRWEKWVMVLAIAALGIFWVILVIVDARDKDRKKAACEAAGGRWIEDSQTFVGIAGTDTAVGVSERDFCVDKSGRLWPQAGSR
jgi:hypothetical protein